MIAGKLIHQVDIMEPASALDDRGQDGATDTVYLAKVHCSIEPINAAESEIAHQIQANRTYKVQFYGNPKKPITHRHWLRYLGRRLEIGSAVDVKMNGTEWELICGETVE
jgi:SPP1 family predicted phage head-tail adaptor